MQAQLWTLNALAVELARDRRALARDLEGLAPDAEERVGKGMNRKWLMARVHKHLAGKTDQLAEQRARLARAQAERVETENAVRRGDLAPISMLAENFGNVVVVARDLLLAIPATEAATLAAMSAPGAVSAHLNKAIEYALHQLSEYRIDGPKWKRSNCAGRRGTKVEAGDSNG